MDAPERIIRDKPFAQRLAQACDSSSKCPPQTHGRLTWLKREIEKHGASVTVETVRKWYSGEAKARPDKLALLAQILEVDMAWLSLGVDAGMEPRERKARNAVADGAVNLIAGFIQMDGGNPAFPTEDDKRAERDRIDLYAIIKGANYAFHVSTGAREGRSLRFKVPSATEAIVLGVLREGFSVEVFEMTPELVQSHGSRRGASSDVTLTEKQAAKHRIDSFAHRL